VRLWVRKLCSVGGKARKQESGAVFSWKVRLWVRKRCSVGIEARKQEGFYLPDVRVESRSCILVESEARSGSCVPGGCQDSLLFTSPTSGSLGQFWPLATGLSTHSRNSILMNLEQESNTHYTYSEFGAYYSIYTKII
jgi:hypothetical protein